MLHTRFTDPDKQKHYQEEHGSAKAYWTIGYNNLEKYAFYLHGGGNGWIKDELHGASRSLPGYVGAKGSRLWNHLHSTEHPVDLTEEEWSKIALWLDLNSEYFGAYYDLKQQAQGEFRPPRMDFSEDPVESLPRHSGRPVATAAKPTRIQIVRIPNGLRLSGVAEESLVQFHTLDGKCVTKVRIHGAATNQTIHGPAARGTYVLRVTGLSSGRTYVGKEVFIR